MCTQPSASLWDEAKLISLWDEAKLIYIVTSLLFPLDGEEDDILGDVMKPKKGTSSKGGASSVTAPSGGAGGDSGSTGNESSRLSVSVLTESSVAMDDKAVQGVSRGFSCQVLFSAKLYFLLAALLQHYKPPKVTKEFTRIV